MDVADDEDDIDSSPQSTLDTQETIYTLTENDESSSIQPSTSNPDLCSICLDAWESIGNHRLCVLKCGHYFGYSCVRRWLTEEGKTCPTCKVRTSLKYIRFLYLKKLVVTDYTELARLKEELRVIREERREKEIELSRVICRENALKQRAEALKKYAECLSTVTEQSQSPRDVNPNTTVSVYLDKSIELCQNGGCRVLNYFERDNILLASVPSLNSLFPGFGARRIDIETYRATTYIALHSKAIRDMKFHSETPCLLSVSLDKCAKIVNTSSAADSFTTYRSDCPLWSCTWDASNSNYLYIGTQQGSVLKLDTRKFDQPILTLDIPGDKCPVLSVTSLSPDSNRAIANGGILSCKLNSIWVFQNDGECYLAPSSLPLEGPFTYMTYNRDTEQFLVTSRPNSHYPYSRYYLGFLEKGLTFNSVHVMNGSTIQTYLSRSSFVTHNSNLYVAAYHESDQGICLWDVNTGSKACWTFARDHIFDICNPSTANDNFVISLTEKKVMFHKFI